MKTEEVFLLNFKKCLQNKFVYSSLLLMLINKFKNIKKLKNDSDERNIIKKEGFY